jgi:UDP-N-acetylglucosamine acyltransferase
LGLTATQGAKFEMTGAIDPTAIIGACVKLGADVRIGPFSILHDGVVVADGARIGAHCELGGSGGRVSIGSQAQLRKGCRIVGDVELADGVAIGENSVLDGAISLGRNAAIAEHVAAHGRSSLGEEVKIGASSTLAGELSIGGGTQVFPCCSIGASPQHPGLSGSNGRVEIGRRCVIREFVTIHLPTTKAPTRIGDDCYIMAGCHINHDCELGDDVKMANAATLAGFVHVGDHAYLGMHSVVHQRMRIGAYAMIGMNALIVHHVPPYATVVGRRFTKINRLGLELRDVGAAEIDAVEAYYSDRIDGGAVKSAWIERIENFKAECDHTNIMPPQFGPK